MKNKKAFLFMCVGFGVIAVIASVLLIAKAMGASIPDAVIRILGVVELIAGPVVLIVAARMYNAEQEQKKKDNQ